MIRKAYHALSDCDLSFMHIKAHEVQALAASWSYFNHASLEDVLRAIYWHSPTIFSLFYLHSLVQESENLYSLGLLVTD